MLHIDEAGLKAVARLRADLEWLKTEHPGKVELIGLVQSHISLIDMAGGYSGFTLGLGGNSPFVYTTEMVKATEEPDVISQIFPAEPYDGTLEGDGPIKVSDR